MGKIIMPKNSALLQEIEAVLKIYYEADEWLANDTYKARLKEIIGDDQYSSSYTKKAQITSYFGFTIWEDITNPQSKRRITPSGKSMYEAIISKNISKIQEILMNSLECTVFGRNNFGCPDSDSDIEAPSVFVRGILDLDYLTYKEFAYLLWKLEDVGGNYTDSIKEIREFRNKGQFSLDEAAQKYTDAKPIMILVRWGFLDEQDNPKGIIIRQEVLEKYRKRLKQLKIYNIDKFDDINVIAPNDTTNSAVGCNKIFYGVPGCGKSWHVEHEVLPQSVEEKENIFRTTFYLDYSNTDFVGQIYPTINGDVVEYKQVPGPFTKALERALRYKDKTVYLVIEEINRGNAAAIFGDLFQLLDRLKENYDGRVVGDSEYPISNEFIEGYFLKQNETYKAKGEPIIDYKPGNIYIPHNLVIYATMNTSDQNVFPLDTAFKRRWQRERILSDWSSKNKIKDFKIPGTEYTWEQFAKGVNNSILKYSANNSISEDKCLGSYFANENMLICGDETTDDIKEKKLSAFVNNVLDYLYNDVTKFEHTILFTSVAESYEKMYTEIFSDKITLDLSKLLKKDVIDEIEKVKADESTI